MVNSYVNDITQQVKIQILYHSIILVRLYLHSADYTI